MKGQLINILWELYRLHRSVGSRSSFGFYNAITALNGITEDEFRIHAMELSDNYKIKYIGSHIQDIIDDYIIGEYTRLENDRHWIYDIGKLDKTLYEINNDIISRRIDINYVRDYLHDIGTKMYHCKFGHGSIDPYRERFGIGSVTIRTDDYEWYNKLLLPNYQKILLSNSKAIYKCRDFTDFLIILKLK